MKKNSLSQQILFFLVFTIIFLYNANSQQQYIQVASRANSYCNSTCTLLDIPELNKNPAAVVIATPVVEGGINLNPHPIGVHFIADKWSIFNLDQAAMAAGSKFNVRYFAKPDANYQFVHVVTKESLQENNTRSFINHPILNNNPEATFQFIVNGLGNNRDEVNIQYDKSAGQWYIYNINKKTIDYNVAYNIVIGPGTKQTTTSPAVAITELITTAQPPATSSTVTFGGNVIDILMSVEGVQQGKFKSETTLASQVNKMELTSFNFETIIPVVISSGQTSGKHINQPITVTKLFGPASLQFYKAFLNNESLSNVTIEYYGPDKSGRSQLINTIKLTNAKIVSFKHNIIRNDPEYAKKGLVEEIKFIYQKIEMTDASGLTVAE